MTEDPLAQRIARLIAQMEHGSNYEGYESGHLARGRLYAAEAHAYFDEVLGREKIAKVLEESAAWERQYQDQAQRTERADAALTKMRYELEARAEQAEARLARLTRERIANLLFAMIDDGWDSLEDKRLDIQDAADAIRAFVEKP